MDFGFDFWTSRDSDFRFRATDWIFRTLDSDLRLTFGLWKERLLRQSLVAVAAVAAGWRRMCKNEGWEGRTALHNGGGQKLQHAAAWMPARGNAATQGVPKEETPLDSKKLR